MLARRVAVVAWHLARADRIEAELFEERHVAGGGVGLALIRDGNGTRSFETLLRYRGAAMAEFWRALRTLKALQAEQAAGDAGAVAAHPLQTDPMTPAARPLLVDRPQPDEPERAAAPRLEDAPSKSPAPVRALHEPAAPWLPPATPWLPKEPEPSRARHAPAAPASRTNPKPHPSSTGPEEGESRPSPRLPETRANPSPVAGRAGRG